MTKTIMKNESFIDYFKSDKCKKCGICLKGCLYQDLDLKEAKQGINNLINNADIDYYLDHCVMCSRCNHLCPVDANPMALILERYRDRRQSEKKLPRSIAFMINGIQGKDWENNFYRNFYKSHNKKQIEILNKWNKTPESSDIIWCGCVTRMFPDYIDDSQVLSHIPKFGGINDCCGNIAVKCGLFTEARNIAVNLIETLSQSKCKRLIVLCGSCQETFTSYYPKYLGIKFPFEVISIYEFLDEQIGNGSMRIQRRTDMDAAVSEPCFSNEFDEHYRSSINRLCDHIGIQTTSLEHFGKNNSCCGINALYRKGKIKDVITASTIKRNDIKACKKKNLLTYCYGCTMTLNSLNFSVKTHFLLEKILWALGDDINSSVNSLIRKMLNIKNIRGLLKIGPSAL